MSRGGNLEDKACEQDVSLVTKIVFVLKFPVLSSQSCCYH